MKQYKSAAKDKNNKTDLEPVGQSFTEMAEATKQKDIDEISNGNRVVDLRKELIDKHGFSSPRL
jgi:hypothetical protein